MWSISGFVALGSAVLLMACTVDATVTPLYEPFPLVVTSSAPPLESFDVDFLAIQEDWWLQMEQVAEDHGVEFGGDLSSSDPNKRALGEYWAEYWSLTYEAKANGEPSNSDSRWSSDQWKFILRNTYYRPIPLSLLPGLSKSLQDRMLASAEARWDHLLAEGLSETAESSLVEWTTGEWHP